MDGGRENRILGAVAFVILPAIILFEKSEETRRILTWIGESPKLSGGPSVTVRTI